MAFWSASNSSTFRTHEGEASCKADPDIGPGRPRGTRTPRTVMTRGPRARGGGRGFHVSFVEVGHSRTPGDPEVSEDRVDIESGTLVLPVLVRCNVSGVFNCHTRW